MTDAEALTLLPRCLDALAARICAMAATMPEEDYMQRCMDAYSTAIILADELREHPELLGQPNPPGGSR